MQLFERQRAELNVAHTQLAAVRAQIVAGRSRAQADAGAQPPSAFGPRTQEEDARERARAQEADTKPLAPGALLPPPGADGQIGMGSQRCIAETKRSGQCRQHTRHGAHCWVHLAQLYGVWIRKSGIDGGGKGLHAARDFAKGDVVARYTGELIPVPQRAAGQDGPANDEGGEYQLLLSEQGAGAIIDAARTNSAEGRMLNDARGSGKANNCTFSCNQQRKTAVVRALRKIKKGEELFVSYGPNYWPKAMGPRPQRVTRARAAQPARKALAPQARPRTVVVPGQRVLRSYAQAAADTAGSRQQPSRSDAAHGAQQPQRIDAAGSAQQPQRIDAAGSAQQPIRIDAVRRSGDDVSRNTAQSQSHSVQQGASSARGGSGSKGGICNPVEQGWSVVPPARRARRALAL